MPMSPTGLNQSSPGPTNRTPSRVSQEDRVKVRHLVAVGAVAAIALTACTSGGSGGSQASGDETGTLTVWLQTDAQQGWPAAVQAATTAFNAKHPKVKV